MDRTSPTSAGNGLLAPIPADRVAKRVLQVDALSFAVAVGVICALGLFVATMVLVLRGAAEQARGLQTQIGPHLVLLRQFLPGYSVTGIGALVGAFWSGVFGFVAAWIGAQVYNLVSGLKMRPRGGSA